MREFLHFRKTTTCSSGSAPSTAAPAPSTKASSTRFLSNLVQDIQTNHRRQELTQLGCYRSLPHCAPQCKFTTRVFHPNVDAQSGNICLDILTPDKWSAVLDVRRYKISAPSSACDLFSSAMTCGTGQGIARLAAVSVVRA